MGWIREAKAFTSNTLGNLLFVVRRNSASAGTGVDDGEVAALNCDANGNLRVNVAASSGGGGATDDAAFTPATGTGTVIMGFADESAPDSVDEGDAGAVRMTLARGLHVNPRNAAGTEIAKAEDAAHTTADPGFPVWAVRRDTAAAGSDTDGDYSSLNVNSTGRLYTDAKITHPTTTVQALNSDVDSGASEALTGSSLPCTGPCIVKAFPLNTGVIYVSFDGTDASSSNGVRLGPGEQTIGYVTNLNVLKVIASTDNQGVTAHAPG